MVMVGGQKRAGFKTISYKAAQKIASISDLRAKQKKYVSVVKDYANNGRKPVTKRIVSQKADQMLKGLKPGIKEYFEEMIKEINKNPSIPIADVSVNVRRTLKSKDPSKYYSNKAIVDLYHAGIKSGAIQIQ